MKKLCEDAAMAMYREGRLDREIADAIGYSRVSVTKWRNDRGLPSNRKRRTEKMIDAYKAAMPLERVQELAQAEKDGRLVVLPCEEVTSSVPPNDPLTLDELREMEADPIWIVREDGVDRWALIRYFTSSGMNTYGCGFLSWEDMGKIWTPYRYKLVPHPQKGGPGP